MDEEEEVLLGTKPSTQAQEEDRVQYPVPAAISESAGVPLELQQLYSGIKSTPSAVASAARRFTPEFVKSVIDPTTRQGMSSALQNLQRIGQASKGAVDASRLASLASPLALYSVIDYGVREATGKGVSERVGEKIGTGVSRLAGMDPMAEVPGISAGELMNAENQRRISAGEPEMSLQESKSMLDTLVGRGFQDDITAPSLATLQQRQEPQAPRRQGRAEAEARVNPDSAPFDPLDRPAIGQGMEGPRTDAGIPTRPAAGQGITPDEAVDSVRAQLSSVQAPAAPTVPATVAAEQAPAPAPTAPAVAPVAPAAPVDPVTAPISAVDFMQQSPGGAGVPAPQVISGTPQEGLVPVIDPTSGDLVYADPATAASFSAPAPARQGPSLASIQADPFYQQAMRERSIQQAGGENRFLKDSMARDARIEDRRQRPGETVTERDTRVAQSRTQKSASAAGRNYTDAQLRDMFPDKKDRAAAKAKDRAGINPVTDKSYAEEEQERRYVDATIAERQKRTEPASTDYDIANQAAEQTAAAEGLQPGTPEYGARVNQLRGMTLYGDEYYAPAPVSPGKGYTAEQAQELDIPYFETIEDYNAADAAGQLAGRDGQKVIVAGQVERHKQEDSKKKAKEKRN